MNMSFRGTKVLASAISATTEKSNFKSALKDAKIIERVQNDDSIGSAWSRT